MTSPVTTINAELLLQRIAVAVVSLLGAIAVGCFVFYGWQMRDPYLRGVLSMPGHAEHGQEIFQINCAGCHGATGDGFVGPSLKHVSQRKSRMQLVHQVVSGKTPPMPKFQPSEAVMADLLSYLESL